MESRTAPEVEIAEADSTTFPFHSPVRPSSPSWSDSTISIYGDENEEENPLPDSTTSSGDSTPDNLSMDLLDGKKVATIGCSS